MEKNWFIYSKQVVSGPFSTEQVKKELAMGRWQATDQIWWRGQKEWLSLDRWFHNLDQILQASQENGQQPVWYAEQDGFQFGPVTKSTLIGYLKNLPHLKNVRLWTVGLNHWTNLFEFHDILDQMNVTKRQFDRAPIVGEVEISKDGKKFVLGLSSVSGGGLGLQKSEDLNVGDLVMVAIRSPLLVTPVRGTAKVMYIDRKGYAGLQFENIHIESKTTLMDYVRQFQTDGSGDPVTRNSAA